jgi:hypothetical protein
MFCICIHIWKGRRGGTRALLQNRRPRVDTRKEVGLQPQRPDKAQALGAYQRAATVGRILHHRERTLCKHYLAWSVNRANAISGCWRTCSKRRRRGVGSLHVPNHPPRDQNTRKRQLLPLSCRPHFILKTAQHSPSCASLIDDTQCRS